MMPLEDILVVMCHYISGKPSHLVTYPEVSLTGLGWDKFTGYYDPTEFDVTPVSKMMMMMENWI